MRRKIFILIFILFVVLKIDIVNANYQGRVYSDEKCKINSSATGVCFYTSSAFTKATWLDHGDLVNVITSKGTVNAPKSGNGSECKTSFSYVEYFYGTTITGGWLCNDNIMHDFEISEELQQEFKDAGFPESYWEPLAVLKMKHPTWTFHAIPTGTNFNDAVIEEGRGSKSLIQSTAAKTQGYLSTDAGDYNWDTDKWKAYDGSTWYAANEQTIAYYMDPRNFLSNTYIFQFESLEYIPELHTLEAVQSLLGSAYIAQFAEYFIEAAETTRVSPVYLASLSRQEVGANKSTAISGLEFTYNNKKYSGLYNFYNIGATSGSDAVYKGLVYANGGADGTAKTYSRPWKDERTAIIGGAQFVNNGYVSNGQNTSYFKKFNVAYKYMKTKYPNAYSNYTHQYMTNIMAPSSEAATTWHSYYKSEMMESNFNFYIPVYNNMPEATYLPKQGNPNNRLKEIKIGEELITGFKSDKFEYDITVLSTTDKINLTATKINSNATVSGTGTKDISVGENNFTITVKAQNGNVQEYKIKITRPAMSSIDPETGEEVIHIPVNEILSKTNLNIKNNYMSNLTLTTDIADFASALITIDPLVKVEVKNNGKVVTKGVIHTGDEITITSGDDTKSFIAIIYGDTNGDGVINALDLLRVQKHILGYSKLPTASAEAADVSKDGNLNALDLLKIQKYILGVGDISQK